MPVEAERLRRPQRARDRLAVAAVLVGSLAIAAGALAVAELSRPTAERAKGCIQFTEAGVLGGGAWHLCGEEANRFCSTRPNQAPTLHTQCDQLRASQASG